MVSLSESGEVQIGFILFNIGKDEFAIDIKIVDTILNTENYNNFNFSTYQNIALAIEEKNESFQLLNLHKLLRYNIPNNIVNTRIILLNVDNHKAAILVDNIKEFVTVNNKTWQFLKFNPIVDKDYIAWKIEYEGRNIFVPDLDKIFRDELLSLKLEK
jgi:chemotaxis signal transduction protein